ncbi:hypothetical protein BDV26DRAFT_265321 [Aspergillus bertholletiae]|uniref:Uncharacterized protein n=1 Tax=Aspergillus bertholletiae TaxID=1226010 RepID=A0A5N7B380_9EURO|nr:hypothetical protein BDV26DRAFT_265321 [Aspergillus bertholletiae]
MRRRKIFIMEAGARPMVGSWSGLRAKGNQGNARSTRLVYPKGRSNKSQRPKVDRLEGLRRADSASVPHMRGGALPLHVQ